MNSSDHLLWHAMHALRARLLVVRIGGTEYCDAVVSKLSLIGGSLSDSGVERSKTNSASSEFSISASTSMVSSLLVCAYGKVSSYDRAKGR
jgi:hypothetical protein